MSVDFSRITRSAALLLATLPGSAALLAQDQTTAANLNGAVDDPSSATLAGAVVTLTGVDNGVVRTATTGPSGTFSFRLLPPASYALKVEAKGFKGYRQEGITLIAGQTATQVVGLTLGSSSEEVTVTDQVALLNTDNANLSAEITSKQVVELPLNLRNVYGLATLNSSVQTGTLFQKNSGSGSVSTADQDISFLQFGGGFFGTSAYLLDGIWDTASDWGAVVYVPSVDSVDEFKIQTNSFTAQYGFSTGNVINVTTKSGSSKFHGDAFEFLRNDKLDANSYFNNFNDLAKPSFRRNQFGGSAGGPLYIPHLYRQTERTFVFGLYEGLRQSTPDTFTGTVPTPAFMNGDFSALLGSQVGTDALGRPVLAGELYNPFSSRAITKGQIDPVTGLAATQTGYIRDPYANNQVPSSAFNPVGAALSRFYPAPTNSGLANNFAATASASATSDEYLIRVDHNINENTRIFGRWAQKRESKINSPAFYGANDAGGPGNIRPNNRFSFVAGLTRIFTPTFAMSVDAGLSRWAEAGVDQGYPFDQSSVGLPGYLSAITPVFPTITVENNVTLGPSQGTQGTAFRNVGSVSVDFTKAEGVHNLSFGFMGALMQNNSSILPETTFTADHGFTAGPDPLSITQQTGYGYASLLLGVPSSGSTYNNFNAATSKKYYGFYTEDDWKIAKSTTLNLGLRYEWQAAPTERHDSQAFFDFNAINPISAQVGEQLPGQIVFTGNGQHRGLYNNSYSNVAPRFGFSHQVNPRLLVRGGYGIFFSPQFEGLGPTPGFSQQTPYTASVGLGITPATTLSNPFPTGLLQPLGRALGGLQDVGQITNAVPSGRRSPYIQEYSLGVQYAFTPNDVLTASFVGNHGTKLVLSSFTHDQLDPKYLAMGQALDAQVPNPFYGHITSSGCGLDQPTVSQGQLLRPYPQYCSVSEPQAPVGFSIYNALQADYNHRFHAGLNVLVSYTYSKFLDNVSGANNWASTGDQGVRNYYDLAAEKSVDASDTPHSLVLNYIYELPVGRGRKFGGNMGRATDAALGGWQVSGISSFKSGFPLAVTGGGTANLYGGNARPDVLKNPFLSHRTIDRWFDTTAFAAPAPYTFGDSPRYFSRLRAPGFQNWDLAAEKYWYLSERIRLQGRAEFYNAFNHANFFAPDTNLQDTGFGTIRASYGPRDLQFALKLYW